jgi:aldose 1-epimerase
VHLYHPKTKVHVEVLTTEPVFQIYTADHFAVPVLEGEKRPFNSRSGVACEPARPTNAAGARTEWRPWVTLKKGDVYGSKTVWVNWKGDL